MTDDAELFSSDRSGRRRAMVALAAVLAVCLTGAGLVLGWMALHPSPAASHPVPIGAPLDPAEPPQALVFVSGAVVHPGLYRLSTGARLSDAVAAAGGLTQDADSGHLPDLAQRVHDGKQVNIPLVKAAARGTSAAGAVTRVDVNTATVDELRGLPGMLLGLPEAIVEARATFGPFASLAQLRTLLGLDAATWSGVRGELRAGNLTR